MSMTICELFIELIQNSFAKQIGYLKFAPDNIVLALPLDDYALLKMVMDSILQRLRVARERLQLFYKNWVEDQQQLGGGLNV
jgi:hypothetical protein